MQSRYGWSVKKNHCLAWLVSPLIRFGLSLCLLSRLTFSAPYFGLLRNRYTQIFASGSPPPLPRSHLCDIYTFLALQQSLFFRMLFLMVWKHCNHSQYKTLLLGRNPPLIIWASGRAHWSPTPQTTSSVYTPFPQLFQLPAHMKMDIQCGIASKKYTLGGEDFCIFKVHIKQMKSISKSSNLRLPSFSQDFQLKNELHH